MKSPATILFSGFALALAAFLFTGAAKADGVVIAPDLIPAEARAKLEAQIARARAKNPKIFAAAGAVDTHLPAGMRRLRTNQPTTARAFRRLGPPALFALIELIAYQGADQSLSAEQRRALGSGLLQALSLLRDPHATPVLRAAFLHAADPVWIEHAAEGLGMSCTDSERALLLEHSQLGSSRRTAAVVGLGYCRTPESAARLAEVLAGQPPAELTEKTLRALGLIGTSWALRADRTIDPKRAEAIQRIAARALVLAYPAQRGELRLAAHRAALMVEHPAVSEWIARVMPGAPADAQRDLQKLELRLRKNRSRAPH